MANTKISALTALAGASVDTAADVLAIVDNSAGATKKILVDELRISLSATQAMQEAGTNISTFVTPGRQQYHPGSAKAWVLFNGTAGTITAQYNVSSVSGTTGSHEIGFTTPFSSANYVGIGTCVGGATNDCFVQQTRASNPTASSFAIQTIDRSGTLTALERVYVAFYGDQS